MQPTPVITKDGSYTLLHPTLDVTYHSRHGALTESLHVFIGEGLKFRCAQEAPKPLRVLEMGFGTGLNALLSSQWAKAAGWPLHYTAVETFPVLLSQVASLGYGDMPAMEKLHASAWNEAVQVHDHFILEKRGCPLQEWLTQSTDHYDLVYYDAFAPLAQPELWTTDIFQKIYARMNEEAVWVTYCSKGDVRRSLVEAGFVVEKIPGPPGKREMLRARVPLRRGGD